MLKLKALLLTQGMHGMVSQVEGLAKALNLKFQHHTIKLKTFWNFVPPILTPVSENLLTEKIICDSRVIISCGRKSVISSIALKRKFKDKIFNIHIQDPKVSTSNFDLVICPEHDGLKGTNVLTTTGAIHYLTSKEINTGIDATLLAGLNLRSRGCRVTGLNLSQWSSYKKSKFSQPLKQRFMPI